MERNSETRSQYRSVRYKVSRQKSTRTADPTTCNFRIKRNSCFESTMANTNTSQFRSTTLKMFPKTEYIQTFHSLMDKEKSKKLEKVKEVSFFESDNLIIPNFEEASKEVENSQFTLLEPINQPIRFVENLALQSKAQLKKQTYSVAQTKAGLQLLKEKILRQLSGIEQFGSQQFQYIRSILRKNQIQQQQRKLKQKRQLKALKQEHQANSKKFKELDGKSTDLQNCIFNSTPFNLKQAEPEKAYS